MSLHLFLGLSLSLLATLMFYLACPNQQWFSRRLWSFPVGVVIALVLTMGAWLLLRSEYSVLSATFVVLTVVMAGLGIWPFFAPRNAPVSLSSRTGMALQKPADRRAGQLPPQWLSKIAIMVGMGLPLALSLAGLVAHGAPGGLTNDTKSQLVMWAVAPLWLTPLALAFFTVRARQLLVTFGTANLLAYLLLFYLRLGA